MSTTQSQVEYLANTRIGEKGQLTIPKQYRDDLGLGAGSSVAVLRVGEGLMLIPEQNRFRILCESIASVFERRQLTPTDFLAHHSVSARTPALGSRLPGREELPVVTPPRQLAELTSAGFLHRRAPPSVTLPAHARRCALFGAIFRKSRSSLSRNAGCNAKALAW